MTFQEEVDNIYSLLTLALVHRDWQADTTPREQRRGYNIGALLVNPSLIPVQAGLNCINSTNNATQHGELRAITSFLEANPVFNLDRYTIYTTLEPCIMCAGMITMTDIDRVVFVQHDVEYSKAFERLQFDSTSIGGYLPYPRKVAITPSQLAYGKQLDIAYAGYLATAEEKILAKFLSTAVAKGIFAEATKSFLEYKCTYSESFPILESAHNFLKSFYHE